MEEKKEIKKRSKWNEFWYGLGEICGAILEGIGWILSCPFRFIGFLCTID